MYKLGERPHHKQKLYAFLILLVAGLIMAGAWAANTYLRPETTLSSSEGIVRHVDVVKPLTKQVTTNIFSMEILKNWQPQDSQLIPKAQYAWRGTGKEDSSRSLDLYVDTIPATMAVNKLLPLRAAGDQIVVGDAISDNCVNFTDSTQADKKTGKVEAKWSGVNFYCDTGNYARNVIGTGTPEAINSIQLRGQASGSHRFFFVYTDHSAEPDYTILTDLLSSFRVR
jgi:hypothetical protein